MTTRTAATPVPRAPAIGGVGMPARQRRSRGPAVAAALSLLIVVALWVRGHGVSDLAGAASGLTSIGRLTGLVSADLLLIQVLLMARVPWIERAYGQDRLARWHRWVGFTSFDLMLAHIVFITIGYAGSAHASLPREAWELVVTYPGMLLATAGTAALVLVVATSVRAARRRLRYESWHLLHLYAYLGVGLALPHQLWTGADFTSSAAATVYWWTVWAVAAAAILACRIGLPVWRNLRHRLRVDGVVAEAPGVYSVYLRGRHLDRLPVRAGQFFQWRFLTGPGWSRAHPYSLSAAPRPDLLRITVKDLGDGSGTVAALRPGSRVLVEGPYGQLTGDRRSAHRLTMIASGVGITPLRALIEELRYRPGDVTLLYRARTDADLVFRRELESFAAVRGVRVMYLLGPRGREGSWLPAGWGHDAAALRYLVPDITGHDVYVCGPEPWMAAVTLAARQAGVPDDRIHLERFSW
jgi:predicted ferric reductase